MKKVFLLVVFIITHLTIFSQETGTVTDQRDGKIYKTVKINNQWIMAENLAYKPETGICWSSIRDMADSLYLEHYGYLYDFKTANSISIPGWHVPTKDEWKAISKYLGGSPKKVYAALIDGGSSGFNAKLSGMGTISVAGRKGIDMIGQTTGFWSSTKAGIKGINIGFTPPARFNAGFIGIGVPLGQGLNVRLIKNN